MDSLKDIIDRQHLNRNAHEDPLSEQLFAKIVCLAEEVCVLHDRLDTCERLSAKGELIDTDAIDRFEPSAEVIEQRLAKHRQYYENLFEQLARDTNERP